MHPTINLTKPADQTVTLAPDTIRIAVATSGSGSVDQSFGRANRFAIYQVSPDKIERLSFQSVLPYHDPRHGITDGLVNILETLAGCTAVVVTQVSEGLDGRLRAAGIEPIEDADVVETAILKVYGRWRRGDLLHR